MSIHEECGVFGILSPQKTDVGHTAYYGLYALQHRGQESCGIVINDDGVFCSHKDVGLVSEVFTADALSRLPQGNMAVGHVRYGTTAAQAAGTVSRSRSTIRKAKWRWRTTGT